jgi:hypothetical protein
VPGLSSLDCEGGFNDHNLRVFHDEIGGPARGEIVTAIAGRRRRWRRTIQVFVGGLVLSVATILLLGSSLEEFIAEYIQEARKERLSQSLAARAKATAHGTEWFAAPSIEYNWLLGVYGKQQVLANDRFSYENQPFLLAGPLAYRSDDSEEIGYIIFWPRQCNDGGCRYDLARYEDKSIEATFYGVNIRPTKVFVNDRMVFLDASGDFIVFNGSKYEHVKR